MIETTNLNESVIEDAAQTCFGCHFNAVADGSQIVSGGPDAEIMYKAMLRNAEFPFLPSLRALCASVFPFALHPKLPSDVSCVIPSETMIKDESCYGPLIASNTTTDERNFNESSKSG
jgi:hypothetical protein